MNLKEIHNIYLIGIGGIGMSALARYFHHLGKQVAGYDKTPSKVTSDLQKLGVQIHFDDAVDIIPENFRNNSKILIVYTPAIPKTNQVFNFYKKHDYNLMKRSEVLGLITKNTFCFAIAGTHGKTTTSAILAHILYPYDATSFLGGISENYHSNFIPGKGKISVVEADEYDKSFLQLFPNIACITSMDVDHLDIYQGPDDLRKSFEEFAEKVTDTLIVTKASQIPGLTYAIDEQADYQIINVIVKNGNYVFDIKTPNSYVQKVRFTLPGKHNLMNALAAFAMADNYGIPLENIKKSLETFKGVERRFTYKIKSEKLTLIDDYAHHPTEINAIYNSFKEMYPNQKNAVIFQPHLFSRTRDFIEDFAAVLSKFDELFLLDIYPARELPIEGVTSSLLLEKISHKNKKITKKQDLVKDIKNSQATVVAMLGAGDIGTMVEEVKNELLSVEKV